jgi:hypothetical protein
MLDPQSANGPETVPDRRRHRRVDVLGQVQVHLVSRPMPTAVRDLSPSGIALETTQPIVPGARHHLLLCGVSGTPAGGVIRIDAEFLNVVDDRAERFSRGLTLFLVGFTFGPMDQTAREALSAIVDDVQELSVDADHTAVSSR